MFLSYMDRPGITVERSMDALDACFTGGNCVVRFDNLWAAVVGHMAFNLVSVVSLVWLN